MVYVLANDGQLVQRGGYVLSHLQQAHMQIKNYFSNGPCNLISIY